MTFFAISGIDKDCPTCKVNVFACESHGDVWREINAGHQRLERERLATLFGGR